MGIRDRVRHLLTELAERYPERELRVMSPLAEGADRLVAGIALDLGIDLIVPLPMARELYIADFDSQPSLAEFESLSERAAEVYELPVTRGHTRGEIAIHGRWPATCNMPSSAFSCAHTATCCSRCGTAR